MHKCKVCGYLYNPEEGDPPLASPGTPFEELPSGWRCPVCNVSVDEFEPVED